MADVLITEFTDPACPWAYSAEPFRQRLDWLYGDRIEWQVRMVVLSESAEQLAASGFGVKPLSAAYRMISREHGMPIDTSERSRMAISLPACAAVVAARLHAPGAARPLLRSLRIRNFAGELLDAPETIAAAAVDAGLDPKALNAWVVGEDVLAALKEDMALARTPAPAALVMNHKLSGWASEAVTSAPGETAGRRYTCPSYDIVRKADGLRLVAPGFQPFLTYEVLLANLLPDVARRAAPESVERVLAGAGEPLASKEVAELCGLELWQAREALGRVATERHVGADGFWSLAA
jgi:predicted DsbA family dithiol-disulfide isomerase